MLRLLFWIGLLVWLWRLAPYIGLVVFGVWFIFSIESRPQPKSLPKSPYITKLYDDCSWDWNWAVTDYLSGKIEIDDLEKHQI